MKTDFDIKPHTKHTSVSANSTDPKFSVLPFFNKNCKGPTI
jgi:hypothetical protein